MNHLQALALRKTFPGVVALDNADFDVHGGEVHAVVGANGAGKSTLAKILAGAYQPTAGEIRLNGQPIEIHTPADALRHGIACAYQEVDTALASYLSVTENVLMPRIARGGRSIFMQWAKLHKDAADLLARVDLTVDVRRPVSDLTLHEKQKVVIAKALEAQARFLILDEPTAPLSLREVDQLFGLIRTLTSEELGIIYISHRMSEVFEIADRITIMRDGQKIETVTPAQSSPDDVVFMMLDKRLDKEAQRRVLTEPGTASGEEKHVKASQPIVFSAQNLVRSPLVNDVSFAVGAGEVLGITGLVGAGKTEVARLLFGADRAESGRMELLGQPIQLHSPAQAVAAGIRLVPEERRQQGVLVDLSIARNLTLPSLSRFAKAGFIQRGQEAQSARRMVDELGVVCRGIEQNVGMLSGGNQQKIAVGKWLISPGHLFLFDEPTKGVDVGAKEEIFRLVTQLADEGKAVIYFSSEISEILAISDRILVLYDGQVRAELTAVEATQEAILRVATGQK